MMISSRDKMKEIFSKDCMKKVEKRRIESIKNTEMMLIITASIKTS